MAAARDQTKFRNRSFGERTPKMESVLYGGPAHTCSITDFVDGQAAVSAPLHLKRNDAKSGSLTLSVVMTHRVGQRARTARHSLPVTTFSSLFG